MKLQASFDFLKKLKMSSAAIFSGILSIYFTITLTRENLSSGFANNKSADQTARMCMQFIYWKVSYLDLLHANFQFSN